MREYRVTLCKELVDELGRLGYEVRDAIAAARRYAELMHLASMYIGGCTADRFTVPGVEPVGEVVGMLGEASDIVRVDRDVLVLASLLLLLGEELAARRAWRPKLIRIVG